MASWACSMLDSLTQETSIGWYPFHLTRYSRSHPLSCLVLQPHFGAKCENATHTPKDGKMESSGTPENSEDDLRGQISSP